MKKINKYDNPLSNTSAYDADPVRNQMQPAGVASFLSFVGDFIGDITGANKAAEEAAAAQRESTQAGVAESRRQFNVAKETLTPFIDFGREALMGLDPASIMRSARSHPGFQFQLDTGIEAIGRSAAARGFRNSGNIMHELQAFGQGLASDFFNQEFTRRFSLAQLGQSSAAALSGASIQTGNTLASLFGQQGTNLASIFSNRGAQLTDMFGTAAGFALGKLRF
jgi:hypothetical protein